jgi:hypothetical protein
MKEAPNNAMQRTALNTLSQTQLSTEFVSADSLDV